ncbi:hypothetical protein QR680_000519 [Steinernema hermaphroditum]|uniref:Uncharacterized protein n=1 Tax=Steinernema hermaphroditum TaxID=289476 RepID=A0AA39GWU5_9BILA|nr:hypothetical protein QR680_000519 [Steinernema hermaphroditum]
MVFRKTKKAVVSTARFVKEIFGLRRCPSEELGLAFLKLAAIPAYVDVEQHYKEALLLANLKATGLV